MKISIGIDCTPEEARAFFGLPNIEYLQKTVLEAAAKRMNEAASNMDAERLFKMWFPTGFKGLQDWQKTFFSQLTEAAKKKNDQP